MYGSATTSGGRACSNRLTIFSEEASKSLYAEDIPMGKQEVVEKNEDGVRASFRFSDYARLCAVGAQCIFIIVRF